MSKARLMPACRPAERRRRHLEQRLVPDRRGAHPAEVDAGQAGVDEDRAPLGASGVGQVVDEPAVELAAAEHHDVDVEAVEHRAGLVVRAPPQLAHAGRPRFVLGAEDRRHPHAELGVDDEEVAQVGGVPAGADDGDPRRVPAAAPLGVEVRPVHRAPQHEGEEAERRRRAARLPTRRSVDDLRSRTRANAESVARARKTWLTSSERTAMICWFHRPLTRIAHSPTRVMTAASQTALNAVVGPCSAPISSGTANPTNSAIASPPRSAPSIGMRADGCFGTEARPRRSVGVWPEWSDREIVSGSAPSATPCSIVIRLFRLFRRGPPGPLPPWLSAEPLLQFRSLRRTVA